MHLELEGPPLVLVPTHAMLAVEAMVEEAFYVSPAGWLGIAVREDLAITLDIRVDRLPTSPDPARPDGRDAIAARLGVEIRPSIAIPF